MTTKDYFLRVRKNSPTGKAMELLTNSSSVTGEQLQEAGGLKRTAWFMYELTKHFDNLKLDVDRSNGDDWADYDYSAEYIDVVGNLTTTVNVETASFTGSGNGAKPPVEVEDIRWPTAPPQIQPMDFFRKPNWFEGMRAMVNNGSHISLAGPPGVGKDTAVMQLAAEEEVPLVVLGGDAGLRKRDLVGSPELVNGTSFFQVSEFAAAAVNGWWALLTEVNAADPDALLLLNGIIETPKAIVIHGVAYPVHPNFRLFISYNPGLIGTKPLPQSFKDRFFPIQLSFLTEYELKMRLESHGMPVSDGLEEILVNGKYIKKNDWPNLIVQFGLNMWTAHENGQMRYQITVRRLKDAVTLMNMNATNGDAKKALRMAVLSAIDSPIESKKANQVLNETVNQVSYQ